MTSFNEWLRNRVYGRNGARVTNPLLHLPAGFTGTTWHGTGFEKPPGETVALDVANLPWELRDTPDTQATNG